MVSRYAAEAIALTHAICKMFHISLEDSDKNYDEDDNQGHL